MSLQKQTLSNLGLVAKGSVLALLPFMAGYREAQEKESFWCSDQTAVLRGFLLSPFAVSYMNNPGISSPTPFFNVAIYVTYLAPLSYQLGRVAGDAFLPNPGL